MTKRSTQRKERQDGKEQQDERGALQQGRGSTRIEDTVVSKVAGVATREVDGIRMGGGTSQSIGGVLSRVPGVSGQSETRGVSVEVGEVESAVDITVTVRYGTSIPQVSEAVRRNVINRVENLVGLRVSEVNITVNDVFYPEQEEQRRQ